MVDTRKRATPTTAISCLEVDANRIRAIADKHEEAYNRMLTNLINFWLFHHPEDREVIQ